MNKKILEKYTNTKKVSCLSPYEKEIEYLVKNNATQVAIVNFLKNEKNLVVSRSYVSRYIKRYILKDPFSKKSKKAINQNKEKVEIETPPVKETSKQKKKSIFT